MSEVSCEVKKFSVVVSTEDGGSRVFVVEAKDAEQAKAMAEPLMSYYFDSVLCVIPGEPVDAVYDGYQMVKGF